MAIAALIMAAACRTGDPISPSGIVPVASPDTVVTYRNAVAYLPSGVTQYRAAIVFLPGLRDPATGLPLDSRGLVRGSTGSGCSIWCLSSERAEVRRRSLELVDGDVALVGTTTILNDPAGFAALLDALDGLAKASKHPELADIPILFVGHSMGGCTAYGFTREHGARVAGFLTMKGACHNNGPALAASDVPGYFLIGALDAPYRRDNITAVFEAGRAGGALENFDGRVRSPSDDGLRSHVQLDRLRSYRAASRDRWLTAASDERYRHPTHEDIEMIKRREFLGMAVGAGAAVVLTPELMRALQQAQLIERAIPSTGEKLPVVGLSFSNHVSCADHGALREVMKTFAGNGGRVIDSLHGNATSEQFHATAANELGIQGKVFWVTRGMVPGGPGGPPQPGAATVNTHIDTWLERVKTPKLDLVMLPVTADPTWWTALKEAKKAGRVRYIGVQTIVVQNQSAPLQAIMRNEPIDFIGVDYDLSNRHVEESILPLAMEKKLGVIAFFPFSNNTGVSCGTVSRNLFARVADRPLPEWAAEFDAKSWAQFFLKYVISHPAITVARVGTTKPSHMLDNMSGGIGRLPDEATRRRMAAFIDALPALPPLPAPPPNPAQAPGIALPIAVLDRYVGEYRAASGFTAIFRREGDRLFVKPGNNPEVPLNARSETRLQDPRGPVFEFQIDAQGKVTGAVLEQQGPQGTQRIPLERK